MLTPLWAKTERSSKVHAFYNPGSLVALCGAFRGPWEDHRYHQHLACRRCSRIAKTVLPGNELLVHPKKG